MLMESIEAIAESAQPAQAEAHSPTAIDMKQESPSLVTDLGETSPFPLKRPRDSSADDPDSESKRLKLDKIDDDESAAVVDIDMAAILGGVMMEMEQEIGKVDGLDSVADIDLSGDPLASVSQEPSSSHDSHPAALSEPLSLMRRTTTSCLSNFAMQLLVILSQHAYNDVYMQLQEKDSEICKSFVAIKALFQQTRAIYSTTDLILNPATLDLTEPDHLTDIQVANLASFCCALFSFDGHHDSSATELLALQDHFFSVFLPGGEEDTVTHEISELFVAVKTHLVIDAVTNADQSAAPVDQLIAEAFSVDWEDKLRARHGGTELMIEEQALIAALQKRKTDLISYASGLPDTVLLKIGFGDEELFRLLNLCLRRKLQSLAGLAARHSIKIPSMLTNGDLVSPMPHELDLAHLFSVADNLADQYLPDSAEPLEGLSDGLSADPAPVPTTENSSLPPPEPIMSAPEPAPAPVSEPAPVPAPVPETAPAPSPTPAPAPALAPAPSPTANGTTNGMTNGMTNGTTHGMTNGMTNDTTNVTTTTEAQDSNDILALVAQSTREYVEKTLNNLSPAPYQPTVPTPTGAAPAAQTTYLSHLQQTQAQSPYYGYPQQVEQPPQPAIHESAEKLPPRQSLPSAVLYDRARQAALSKSNNQQRREGNTSTRRPWSQEEERALMTGLDMVQGPHWSQILSLFGPEGTLSQILKDRTQVQLKDKARNLKLFFLKTNSEMPYYLQAVTGELKTRAPTQAARKEAEERARMNSEEEQARVQGIMTLASGLQHPQHSRANVPSANGGHAVLQPAAQISHHMAAQHPAAAQHGAVNGQPAASADTTPTHHRVPASSPYAATAQQLSQTPHALAHTPAHSPTQHHMQHPSHPGTPQPNHQQHHQQQHPHQQQQQQQPQQQQAPQQQHQEHAQPPASQPAEAAPQYAADASAPAYSQENDDLKEAALLRELEAYSDNAIIS